MACRYEFGSVTAAGTLVPRTSGTSSSVTLTSLGVGTTMLYGCAFDSERASDCSYANVTVTQPSNFDASTALNTVDLYALSQVIPACTHIHGA